MSSRRERRMRRCLVFKLASSKAAGASQKQGQKRMEWRILCHTNAWCAKENTSKLNWIPFWEYVVGERGASPSRYFLPMSEVRGLNVSAVPIGVAKNLTLTWPKYALDIRKLPNDTLLLLQNSDARWHLQGHVMDTWLGASTKEAGDQDSLRCYGTSYARAWYFLCSIFSHICYMLYVPKYFAYIIYTPQYRTNHRT